MELYLIRHGRLARQARVEQAPTSIAEASRELAQVAAELGTPPLCVGREEVDQINIVARWISHHSEDSDRAFFSLPTALDRADELDAFAERVAAIVCAPAPDDAVERDERDEEDEFADAELVQEPEW